MIGTKLAHYEITAHLGSGGMGDVYQAVDSKLGRNVAIKVLPDLFAGDAERIARFEREARRRRPRGRAWRRGTAHGGLSLASASVHHPSICCAEITAARRRVVRCHQPKSPL